MTDKRDLPARIGFSVTANGVRYHLTSLQLAPHETRAIDLRQLRDAQVADFQSSRVPNVATDGSVTWVRIDNVPVAGRLVVISRSGGIASNYDCQTCNCPITLSSVGVTPGTCAMIPGGTMQCTATANYQNCNGYPYPSDVTDSSTWSSNNTSVSTVNSTGLETGQGGGTSTITASFTGATSYTYNCLHGCTCIEHDNPRSGSHGTTGQMPARLVSYNTTCAPSGVGPLVTVNNGNIVDCAGNVRTSGVCGDYRNFTYQLVDQFGNPFMPAYTLNEHFSNFSTTNPALTEPAALQTSVAAGGYVRDLQAAYFFSPSCLGSNDNAAYDQSFSVTVGTQNYNLSTVVHLSLGRFSGTYEVNNTITIP